MMLDKCFVIMPFSKTTEAHTDEYWSNHFSNFLEPLIKEKSKLPVKRSTALRTTLLQDIIRDLIYSKLVIADITDFKPNVLWELGVRQSFTNGTIVISEQGTEKPFNISLKPILQYPKKANNPKYNSGMDKFKQDLSAAILDWKENPEKSDSHVLEILSGRGTIYEIIFREENIRKIEAILHELEYNKQVFAHCFRTILKNREQLLNTNPTALTNQVSVCAIELLITTRYLNESSSFYTKMIDYYSAMNAVNGRIALWAQNRDGVEKWFLNPSQKWIELIEGVEQILNQKLGNLKNLQ